MRYGHTQGDPVGCSSDIQQACGYCECQKAEMRARITPQLSHSSLHRMLCRCISLYVVASRCISLHLTASHWCAHPAQVLYLIMEIFSRPAKIVTEEYTLAVVKFLDICLIFFFLADFGLKLRYHANAYAHIGRYFRCDIM